MGSAGGDACSHCSRAGPELGTDGEGIGADEGSGSGSEPGASGSDERDPTGFRLLRQRDVRDRLPSVPLATKIDAQLGLEIDRRTVTARRLVPRLAAWPAPKPKKMTMAGPFGAGYDR